MKSWRFFYGKLHVIVCETNEIDYKEESHQIFLDRKPESKAMINCRAQFRKTVNKKIGDNDDELGAGTSIIDYGYNNATSSLYESKKKMSIFTFNNSARNPMLWIKIDAENEFFHEIDIRYESEAVLLMQLTKEKDAGAIFNLLNSLKNFPNLTTVGTLCSLLETKESDIYIKLLIIRCLLSLSSALTGWRSLDMLMNILRKNCLEQDGSLKPNNFSRFDEYLVNKTIIHGIAELRDEKNEDQQHYMSLGTLNFLLKLLQENDNSKNEFSDTLYKRELIRAILKSNNPKSVSDVMAEVFRCLEEEIACPSEKHEILKTILRYFPKFLEINNLNKKSVRTHAAEKISKIRQKMKFLSFHAPIDYFSFKIHFTDKFRKFFPWELIAYGLKKIEKYRAKKFMKFCVFEGMVLALVKYIEKQGDAFSAEMQTALSLYNNWQVAGLVWEQMTSGIALISPKIRTLWLRLYRALYYYYFPLNSKSSPESFAFTPIFPLNTAFLEDVQLKKSDDPGKSKNILNLNYLSVNKRKRVSLEKTKLNPKETLISCLTKLSVDNEITWKSLARCILTILLSEKHTENNEKILNEEIGINENAELNFVIKIRSPLTLKLVKKKLIKGLYENLDQIQAEIFEVLETYKKNDLITAEIGNEYTLLIESLFQEAKKLLIEVKEKNFRLENYNQNKIKLPKIKLTYDGKEMKFNNVARLESKNLDNQ